MVTSELHNREVGRLRKELSASRQAITKALRGDYDVPVHSADYYNVNEIRELRKEINNLRDELEGFRNAIAAKVFPPVDGGNSTVAESTERS